MNKRCVKPTLRTPNQLLAARGRRSELCSKPESVGAAGYDLSPSACFITVSW
jgi:hypothetical protein